MDYLGNSEELEHIDFYERELRGHLEIYNWRVE